MPVRKTHRTAEAGTDLGDAEDLVQIDLGRDTFQADLVRARLRAEGVVLGGWNTGLEASYGIVGTVGGNQILVRREDLPVVQAVLRDAGLS